MMAAMDAAGLNTSTPQVIGGKPGTPSTMTISATPANVLTSLAPGIQLMYVIESKTTSNFIIMGEFGGTNVEPTVTINGNPVTVEDFTETQLTCDLPNDPSNANFAGPVVVTINNIKSNQVSLTKYVGDIHYEMDSAASSIALGSGTMKQTADYHFIGRADVHLTVQTHIPTRPCGRPRRSPPSISPRSPTPTRER